MSHSEKFLTAMCAAALFGLLWFFLLWFSSPVRAQELQKPQARNVPPGANKMLTITPPTGPTGPIVSISCDGTIKVNGEVIADETPLAEALRAAVKANCWQMGQRYVTK